MSSLKITNEILMKTIVQINDFLNGSFSNFKQYDLLYLNLFALRNVLFDDQFFTKLKAMDSKTILKYFLITAVCFQESDACQRILDRLRSGNLPSQSTFLSNGPSLQSFNRPRFSEMQRSFEAPQLSHRSQQFPDMSKIDQTMPQTSQQQMPSMLMPNMLVPNMSTLNSQPETTEDQSISDEELETEFVPSKDRYFNNSLVSEKELKEFQKEETKKLFSVLDKDSQKELRKLMNMQKNEVKKIVKDVSTGNAADYTELNEINENISNFSRYYANLLKKNQASNIKTAAEKEITFEKKVAEKKMIRDLLKKAQSLQKSSSKIKLLLDMINIEKKILKLLNYELESSSDSESDKSVTRVQEQKSPRKSLTSPFFT